MTELEAKAKDCIENHTHKLVDKPTKQDIYLREESIFISGYRLGATENGIQWQKVDDGDLPKKVGDYVTNIGVLTYDNYGNGVHKWHTPYCEACDYADEVGNDEVIAWCEIPQFKE